MILFEKLKKCIGIDVIVAELIQSGDKTSCSQIIISTKVVTEFIVAGGTCSAVTGTC